LRRHLRLWLLAACIAAALAASCGSAAAHAKRTKVVTGERAAKLARRFLGVPYRWGGSSPAGFDCSGLVSYIYGRLGVRLPRTAAAQYWAGRRIRGRSLRPGDLVFFYGLGHVGIYVGKGRFVAATHTGGHVSLLQLWTPWYRAAFDGAARVA
jgi:cell wall-associated NlpC family hydrolase